jgi:hypothetical protein
MKFGTRLRLARQAGRVSGRWRRIVDDLPVLRRRPAPAPVQAPESTRLLYLLIGELARRHDPSAPPVHPGLDLAPFELRVFSQNGEDGVIAELVRRAGAPGRFFVEFGIGPGLEGNCVALAQLLGWSGLFIEPSDDAYGGLARRFAGHPGVRTEHAGVTPDNVEELFARAGVPAEPDVLSIDVDGNDYWIWAALESFRPRIVVIEYNGALDHARRLVQPLDPDSAYDGTDFYGASLGALRALGESKGYRLAHTDLAGVNAFFVRSDLNVPLPDEVPARDINLFLAGVRHQPHAGGKRFLDLDAGA